MKNKFLGHLFFTGLVLILLSCSKSNNNSNVTAPSFTWTVGGTTYTADTDTAFISGPFTINARKDAALPVFKIVEINLSAFTTGAYTLSSTGVNQLNYFTSSGLITSQSGTVNITANTGSALSGNFTTTLTGNIAMTGSFSNVPIKP